MATIQDKTRALIAQKLSLSESEITPDKNFTGDLGADSLDIVEISMLMEREFNIKFAENDTEKIHTVADVYQLIEQYTSNK